MLESTPLDLFWKVIFFLSAGAEMLSHLVHIFRSVCSGCSGDIKRTLGPELRGQQTLLCSLKNTTPQEPFMEKV